MNIVFIATPLPDMGGRQVLRCDGCFLVQFLRKTPYCVRCRRLLYTDEMIRQSSEKTQSDSAPVVVEVERKLKPWEFARENAKRIRLQKGLSQRQVAERMGTARTWVSKIESGHADLTYLESLERLAKALDVTVSDLLGSKADEKLRADEQAVLNDPFLSKLVPYVGNLSKMDKILVLAKLKDLVNQKDGDGQEKAA